jgi:hypothetical protein
MDAPPNQIAEQLRDLWLPAVVLSDRMAPEQGEPDVRLGKPVHNLRHSDLLFTMKVSEGRRCKTNISGSILPAADLTGAFATPR